MTMNVFTVFIMQLVQGSLHLSTYNPQDLKIVLLWKVDALFPLPQKLLYSSGQLSRKCGYCPVLIEHEFTYISNTLELIKTVSHIIQLLCTMLYHSTKLNVFLPHLHCLTLLLQYVDLLLCETPRAFKQLFYARF